MLHYFAINYDIVLQDFKINQLELSLYFYYNIILPIEIIATQTLPRLRSWLSLMYTMKSSGQAILLQPMQLIKLR